MNDRELLELAAKAAGYEFHCGDIFEIGDSKIDCTDMLFIVHDDGDESAWSPLTDDGDAFRLSVKLNLRISIEAERAGVITVEWNSDGDGSALSDVEEYAPIGGDDYAATRRAIVRAASEIGKSML